MLQMRYVILYDHVASFFGSGKVSSPWHCDSLWLIHKGRCEQTKSDTFDVWLGLLACSFDEFNWFNCVPTFGLPCSSIPSSSEVSSTAVPILIISPAKTFLISITMFLSLVLLFCSFTESPSLCLYCSAVLLCCLFFHRALSILIVVVLNSQHANSNISAISGCDACSVCSDHVVLFCLFCFILLLGISLVIFCW